MSGCTFQSSAVVSGGNGSSGIYAEGRHRHTIELFDLDGLGSAVYRSRKLIDKEVVNPQYRELRTDLISYDSSPQNSYIYFIQKAVTQAGNNGLRNVTDSRLLVYSETESANVTDVVRSILALNSGKSNQGLPCNHTASIKIRAKLRWVLVYLYIVL